MRKIAVIGLGYVGLPLAIEFGKKYQVIGFDINEERNRSMIGKTLTVLCEDFDPVSEMHFGRSEADAPEIDGKIYFRSDKRIAPGSFVKVKIREVVDYDLIGRAIIES